MNDSDVEQESDFSRRLSAIARGHTELRFPSRPTQVSSLSEISYVAIAVALWKHENLPSALSMRFKKARKSPEWSSFRWKVRRLVADLPLPSPFLARIENHYLDKIENEIHNWVTYHHRTVFFENGSDYPLYYHIHDLVWHPDGTINCKKTAEKLRKSIRLNDIEKFRFLSTYCLVKEMEEISPAVYSDRFKDYVPFHQYPLICYWNAYFKNQLDGFLGPLRQNHDLNAYMVRNSKVDNWSAKEFFFDNLTGENKITCAKDLIKDYKLEYQQLVLMKLDEVQRLQLFASADDAVDATTDCATVSENSPKSRASADYAVNVMSNYAGVSKNLPEILPTWVEIRNLITRNEFLVIFKHLLDKQTDDTVLTNIWREAPDEFKKRVLDHNNHIMVEKIFFYGKLCERGELLFAMLSDMKPTIGATIVKKEYFRDFCEHLLDGGLIPALDKVLNLCLPRARDFVQFKLNLATNSEAVKKICTNQYKKDGDVKKIDEYLELLMPNNPEAIVAYKKNLLLSENGIEIGISYLFSAEKRDELRKIIEDGLPTNELATEFGKKLIFSSWAVCALRRNLERGDMDEAKQCIDTFLKSEEDKTVLKKRLINDVYLLRKLFTKLNQSKCESIIRWCLGNHEAIEKFKITLPFDAVFDEVLKYCVFVKYDEGHRVSMCTYLKTPDFGAINMFLDWYFASASKINRYKLQRLYSWMNIETITTLLKKKNEKYIKAVMSWFFQRDKKQIHKFKKKFAGEKIVSVV